MTQLYGSQSQYSPVYQQQLDQGVTVTAQAPQVQPPQLAAPASMIQSALDTNLSEQLASSSVFAEAVKGSGAISKFFGKAGGLTNNSGGLASTGLGVINGIASALNPGKEERNSLDSTRNTIFKTGNQIASAFGPVGVAASAVNNIVDATGGFSDTSKGLGGGNDALNFASSIALPGAGWFTRRLDNYNVSDTLGSSSSYTGTASDNQNVSDNIAGRKILFGRGRAKDKINQAQRKDTLVNNILREGDDAYASASNTQLYSTQDQLRRAGSSWIYNIRAAKNGMSLEDARKVIKKAQKFAEGGKMNVIPDGALHARKHNLAEINPELEGVTPKGIPVVSQEDGGMVQHAEVEREEIIFTKEVTDRLEELRALGTEEAAIEAGKLLSEQIMENTIDNTENILHNED